MIAAPKGREAEAPMFTLDMLYPVGGVTREVTVGPNGFPEDGGSSGRASDETEKQIHL